MSFDGYQNYHPGLKCLESAVWIFSNYLEGSVVQFKATA